MSATGGVEDPTVHVRRARIEEIRELAGEYAQESSGLSRNGAPFDAPVPPGGIFWVAEDEDAALGYAAGSLRRDGGMTIGPVFVRPEHRRRGVGLVLLRAIQGWAVDTRVPVVEVSVASDNIEGIAFLGSSGYVPRRILFSLTPEREGRPDHHGGDA